MTIRSILFAALVLILPGCKPEPPVAIKSEWVRATPPGAKTGAAYLTILNGDEPDRLLGATSNAAEAVSLHETALKDGVMTMRPLTEGVPLPAKAAVAFKPGGRHLMFTGLKAPFVEGDDIEVILHFERAGGIRATLPVRAAAPYDGGHSH